MNTSKETNMASNEERYKVIFIHNRDALLTLDAPDWKFTSANPAAVAMFMSKDENDLLSNEPWTLSPERQPDGQLSVDKAKEMIKKALQNGSNLFEWTHRRLDGNAFSAEVLLSKVEMADNEILIATVRDVSDRVILNNDLKEQLATINEKNSELERINTLMVGRELEMMNLKTEIVALKNDIKSK